MEGTTPGHFVLTGTHFLFGYRSDVIREHEAVRVGGDHEEGPSILVGVGKEVTTRVGPEEPKAVLANVLESLSRAKSVLWDIDRSPTYVLWWADGREMDEVENALTLPLGLLRPHRLAAVPPSLPVFADSQLVCEFGVGKLARQFRVFTYPPHPNRLEIPAHRPPVQARSCYEWKRTKRRVYGPEQVFNNLGCELFDRVKEELPRHRPVEKEGQAAGVQRGGVVGAHWSGRTGWMVPPATQGAGGIRGAGPEVPVTVRANRAASPCLGL